MPQNLEDGVNEPAILASISAHDDVYLRDRDTWTDCEQRWS